MICVSGRWPLGCREARIVGRWWAVRQKLIEQRQVCVASARASNNAPVDTGLYSATDTSRRDSTDESAFNTMPVSPELTVDELNRLRIAFSQLDKDGDGLLAIDEMAVALSVS